MRPSTLVAIEAILYYTSAAYALPEIAIAKHRHADASLAKLKRREPRDTTGTLQTSTYEILEWSIGGGYYVNGEYSLNPLRRKTGACRSKEPVASQG